MKNRIYYLVTFTILLISLNFTNTSVANASESFNISDDLVVIDTSIVPDSYRLEVLVDKNELNKEDMLIHVNEHTYKIVDEKLVEVFNSTPSFSTYAILRETVIVYNGFTHERHLYAAAGTTVHTGSSGPAERREHTIKDHTGKVLSSILSNVATIGCQKTVPNTGKYIFTITNYSATTQTWDWTTTF